jgi:hypothetical protein
VQPLDDPCPSTESETNNRCSSVETLTVSPEVLACICEIEMKRQGFQAPWTIRTPSPLQQDPTGGWSR